jgi:cation diffusion facilitator CzcD-associated flavoprotein CzcO
MKLIKSSHTYTFPFEPNPEWSGYYAYAPEIQEYFLNFYKKNNLQEFVQLNTEVVSAEWDDVQGIWNVELKNGEKTFHDTCNVLINGSGVLAKWKWPDIEGLHDFQGKLAHSANWPQDLDITGKRVAVIGTGSSSIQIIPQIVEKAKKVTVLARNVTYIGPQFGSNVTNEEADPNAMDPAAVGKHQYTEKEKQRFRDDPEYLLQYRIRLEQSMASGWDLFNRGTELHGKFKESVQQSMRDRLGTRDDLKEKLIPNWSPGCRRLTPGEGYLEALTRENVEVIWGEISRVTNDTVVTSSGQSIPIDILICATGFDVQYLPHFKLTGLRGKVIQDQKDPNVYASVAHPGFPNYFVVNGPRGNWGQGCALPSHDIQIGYIFQCVRKMQEDQIKSMQPSQRMTDQLNAYQDAWHTKHSVWAEDCKSWYKVNQVDGRVFIWNGSLLHHVKFMKRPRFEHFELEYRDADNVFAFLGMGKTIGEVKYGANVPVPYIRNREDEEFEIE